MKELLDQIKSWKTSKAITYQCYLKAQKFANNEVGRINSNRAHNEKWFEHFNKHYDIIMSEPSEQLTKDSYLEARVMALAEIHFAHLEKPTSREFILTRINELNTISSELLIKLFESAEEPNETT